MALCYRTLASGSSGNCLWVRGGGVELLVDCGISARRIEAGLRESGTCLEAIEGVVCTHSHGDHVQGALALAGRHGRTLWATRGTREGLSPAIPEGALRDLPRGESVRLGGLCLTSLATSHDAP